MSRNIQFREIHPLRGPNMWTYHPALQAIVDIGDLEDCPSDAIPGYGERLKALLPSLVEHRCSYGQRGGFLRRVEEGTWPAHILEHVTLELQNLAGLSGGFGRARETSERGVYKVVVRAWQEDVARAALFEARDLIMAAMEDREFDVEAAVGRLAGLIDAHCLDPSTADIVEAAAERGIPAIRLLESGNLVQLGYGAAMRRIWTAGTDRTGAIAEGISRDRELTRRLLRSCGVPVTEGREAGNLEDAWDAALEIGLPVCVKSADGGDRRGVLTDIRTREGLETALGTLAGEGGGVRVERSVPGAAHRLLIVGGKLVVASRAERVEPGPIRGIHATDPVRDVTDEVHPETAEAAALAARVVGLDIADIDLVCEDISRPLDEQGGAIVGIEAGLHRHPAPGAGKSRSVGRAIVDHLFPGGGRGRIPVVGVTGSHGATAVARITASLLTLSGKHTGLACGDGLFFDRRRSEKGDCARWEYAKRILMNRVVEAAVFENGSDAIATEGLAYDRCQVGVITGFDAAKHLGRNHIETPEDVFKVLRTQIDVILKDGTAILDAEMEEADEMAGLCDGEVIYFASDPSLPIVGAHLEHGGRAVIVRYGQIMLASGDSEIPLARLKDVPFIGNGGETGAALAAVGAAWALGITPDVMRTGIETFFVEDS
jgi:cyanophycin synthetase